MDRPARWLMLPLALTWMGLAACQPGGNQSAAAPADENANAEANLSVGYVATEYDIVRAMLDLAQVKPDDLVVDLGSGDGRIPIMAAREKGARGLGVELDPDRVRQSRANAQRAGVSDRVEFHQQDLFVTPLNDVTVLTLYLLPEINLQLRPKILAQMRPGARVISNSFDMGDWRSDDQRRIGDSVIYLWIVPARIEGRWRFELEGGGSGTMRLDQRYQDFSGTVSGSGSGAIADGRLHGAAISFVADLGAGRRRYEGRVDGDTIIGTGWRATRAG